MHRLQDNILVTPALLRRIDAEAAFEDGDGRFHALIQRNDGSYIGHLMGPQASAEQMMFGCDVLKLLNTELHHDGAWLVEFTNPGPSEHALLSQPEYQRFALMWMDRDGDVQFTLDWIAGEGDLFDFADVLLAGLEMWGDHAEEAWKIWHEKVIQALAPTEAQTIKAAQGQTAPTVH